MNNKALRKSLISVARNFFILFVLVILLFAFYQKHIAYKVITITDVTKEQKIIINENKKLENTSSARFKIKGFINGSAFFTYGAPEKKVKVNNKIELVWGGDWYINKEEIEYKPIDVSSGQIKIYYKFYE